MMILPLSIGVGINPEQTPKKKICPGQAVCSTKFEGRRDARED